MCWTGASAKKAFLEIELNVFVFCEVARYYIILFYQSWMNLLGCKWKILCTSASNCFQCCELQAIASLVEIPGFLAIRAGLICTMNLKNGVNGLLGFSIPKVASADFLV